MRRYAFAAALTALISTQAWGSVSSERFNDLSYLLWNEIGALQACHVLVPNSSYKYAAAADDFQNDIRIFYDVSDLESDNFYEVGFAKVSLGRSLAAVELTARGVTAAERIKKCDYRLRQGHLWKAQFLKLLGGIK